jgi:hypothetical protein
MTADWRALAKGLLAYWVLSLPIYVPWYIAIPQPFAVAITYLPYLAAFIAGAVFSHFSKSDRDRDCVFLGIAIGISVGLANLILPLVGGHSDLPGLNYSLFIAAFAGIISVVLVLAGAAARTFFRASKPRA